MDLCSFATALRISALVSAPSLCSRAGAGGRGELGGAVVCTLTSDVSGLVVLLGALLGAILCLSGNL